MRHPNRPPSPTSRERQARMVAFILIVLATALVAHLVRDAQKDGKNQATAPVRGTITGHARIVDGDSLFVDGVELRLQGIDAPEGRQTCTREGRTWPCGEHAGRHLSALIGGQMLSCRITDTDKHRRGLAYCTASGRDLNAAMVADGYALAYGSFTIEERSAENARRGLWSGEFERPRDWRRTHGIP